MAQNDRQFCECCNVCRFLFLVHIYYMDLPQKHARTMAAKTSQPILSVRQIFLLFLFFMCWRATLLFVGSMADHFLPYKPSFPYADDVLVRTYVPRWLYSWANFDGVHYLLITDYGYKGIGYEQAFFPLFPYVILHTLRELFDMKMQTMFLTGFSVVNIFALLFTYMWFIFVKEKWGSAVAWLATILFFSFPTAFFLGAVYTESLFLFLIVLSFYAAERKWWAVCGIATALATATRIVGIFLVPALLTEVFLQYSKKVSKKTFSIKHITEFLKSEWQKIVWVLFGSIGMFSYMLFLALGEFHDPFYFIRIQHAFGGVRSVNPVLYPQVLWRSFNILRTYRPFDFRYFAYIQEFVVGLFGFLGLLWSFKFVRFSLIVFAFGAFLLPPLTGTFSSMPRYILVCLPLFLLLTKVLEKKPSFTLLWLSVSTVLLIINTMLFIQGYWIA